MQRKPLFALDFDGVICDSAVETAMTGWKVAQDVWPDMRDQWITDKQIGDFRRIRPCLEVGYEAILILRMLQQRVAMSGSCKDYDQQLQAVIKANDLNPGELQDSFGQTRDREIQRDEAAWVVSNPLFKKIAEKLKALNQDDWVIVTTKQERFVSRILQGNNIQLDEACIFGLDQPLNKQEVLRLLITQNTERPVIFIEDRLPTLLGVLQNKALRDIKLQLVDWGYNTIAERRTAQEKGIEVIGKDGFLREY